MRAFDFEWEDERLHKQAVAQLVEKYRDEYDELAGNAQQERVRELEGEVLELTRALAHHRGQNPNGTNVGALEQTVNGLAKENDRLAKEVSSLTRKLATKTKQLEDIQKAVKVR